MVAVGDFGKLGWLNVGDDRDQLIAAPASSQIERAGAASESGAHHLDDTVANAVAVAVVDSLQLVDVDEDEAEGSCVTLQLEESSLDGHLGEAPIRQLGQSIEVRQLLEAADALEVG